MADRMAKPATSSITPTSSKESFAQFLYVGAQVGTWSYYIQYIQDYTHRPEKIAGYFLTGTLGGLWSGKVHGDLSDEILPAHAAHGGLWHHQHGPRGLGSSVSGLAGRGGCVHDQFLHVAHVPHHFCARHQGIGSEHEVGRLHHHHVDHRRRLRPARHGPDLSSNPQHGRGHAGADGVLRLYYVLRVLWIACASPGLGGVGA